MTLSSTLRLERLSLKNFRCFAECSIQLDPRLTVLVAENGLGKTAVLDAIGLSLGTLVNTVAGAGHTHGFDGSDVRLRRDADGKMTGALPVEISVHGSVDGQRLQWSRALTTWTGKRLRTTTKDEELLRKAAQGLRDRLEGFAAGGRAEPPPLPLVVFYGTGRLWSEHRLTEGKRTEDPSTLGRLSGYVDCLSSSSSFKSFVAWYESRAIAAKVDPASAYGPSDRPEKQLAAVRQATKIVLAPTGWQGIDWEFPALPQGETPTRANLRGGVLVGEHPEHGRLPLYVLSDGVRNMIALVADLAHRCVVLNPHFGEAAAQLTPGILLIDEIDQHLHPRWQQLVVGLLQQAFPAMQMILTTHSPHVLSTVDVDSIRVIRVHEGRGVLDTPTFQTKGVESADVLASIMGVDPVPQVEEARWLADYRALIEDGKAQSPEAAALRDKLVNHFGPKHPLLLDVDRLLRFQAFKLRRAAGGGEVA